MWQAIGFAVVLIAIAVLAPNVFQALENFLLLVLQRATQFVQALPVPAANTANVYQNVR